MNNQREGPVADQRAPDNHSKTADYDKITKFEEQAKSQGAPDSENSEPVNGADLLDRMASEFRRYLSLPEGAADVMALWVVFAWCYDAFKTSPRLALQSPIPGCGKTTVLDILKCLVPNPIAVSNISAPTYFGISKRKQPSQRF